MQQLAGPTRSWTRVCKTQQFIDAIKERISLHALEQPAVYLPSPQPISAIIDTGRVFNHDVMNAIGASSVVRRRV